MNRYRLKEIDIEGFRIYSEKTKIKLFDNLTIVYGRNGRGKTSLQDALSWLFNNDILRYADYNREWTRVKRTHTRSLIHPEIPTEITGVFESIATTDKFIINRNELGINYDKEFTSWFKDKSKKDLLWANLLSQSKLQELASAKGRDRLENLAPLLDLTEINEKVRLNEEEIKTLKDAIDLKGKEIITYTHADYELLINQIEDIYYNAAEENKIEITRVELEGSPLEKCTTLERELNNLLVEFNKVVGSIKFKLKNVEEKKFMLTDHLRNSSLSKLEVKSLEEKMVKNQDTVNEIRLMKKKKENIKNDFNNITLYKEKLTNIVKELNIKEEQRNILLNSEKYEEKISLLEKELIELKLYKTQLEKNLKEFLEKEKDFLNDITRLDEIKNKRIELHSKVQELKLKLFKEEKKDYYKMLENFENKLIELGSNNEELIKQKKEIDHAYKIFEKNDKDGKTCPYCGIEHASTSELRKNISDKKVKWEIQFEELGTSLSEILANISLLKDKKTKQTNEVNRLKDYENLLIILQVEKEAIFKRISSFIQLYFEENISSESTNELNKFLGEIKNKIEYYYSVLQEKTSEIEKYEKLILTYQLQQTEFIFKKETLQKEIELLVLQKEEKKLSIAEVFNKYSESHSSNKVEFPYADLNTRLEEKIGEKVLENNAFIKEEIEQKLLRHYQIEIEKTNNSILTLKKAFELINGIKEIQKILNDKVVAKTEKQQLEEEMILCKKERKALREEQRVATNKEIGKLSSRISMIFEMLSDFSPWRTIKSDAVVPGDREKTNLIFRPIPKLLELDVEEYILKTNSNSTFAFSGGQLSLLGLSIFLSQVAESGEESTIENQLDTLFIDDPIQMLDTLRDDTLISLLSDIARDRQVIISTSDINFANKLILASRPIWNKNIKSCGVIHYEELTTSGPNIVVQRPDEWVESQRIYLPQVSNV